MFFMARRTAHPYREEKKKGLRGGDFGTGGAVRGVLAVTGEAIPLGVCP